MLMCRCAYPLPPSLPKPKINPGGARAHTLKNHETGTEQEKWLRNMCQPCPEGLFQPSAGLTCGKQQAVSNRQQLTRAQGQLQLGFIKLSLSISEHLGVTSHCHR